MAIEFVLRFDGRDAQRHMVDMRLLGRSLVGAEHAIQKGLWVAMHPDLPQGRKRLDLTVQVEAPKAACVEIHGALAGVAGVLPFAHEVATSLGVDYIKHLLTALVMYHGGRPSEYQASMDKALDIIGEQVRLQAADRQLERQSTERLVGNLAATMERMIAAGKQDAKDFVAPVGPSAESLRIGGPGLIDATEIDVAIADAVRSTERLEVGDMETISVRFDALTRHNKAARVELPESPGTYYPADIRDPQFDEFPNAYSEAFSAGESISVRAKLSRRTDGELVRMHILDTAD